ncbi:hypothetical protein [Catenulispora subtropica]|uniref:hypothetical protein n=1 Tax=Catenulispora subtropica TaxID=450798 RepID=UPI0031DE6D17
MTPDPAPLADETADVIGLIGVIGDEVAGGGDETRGALVLAADPVTVPEVHAVAVRAAAASAAVAEEPLIPKRIACIPL